MHPLNLLDASCIVHSMKPGTVSKQQQKKSSRKTRIQIQWKLKMMTIDNFFNDFFSSLDVISHPDNESRMKVSVEMANVPKHVWKRENARPECLYLLSLSFALPQPYAVLCGCSIVYVIRVRIFFFRSVAFQLIHCFSLCAEHGWCVCILDFFFSSHKKSAAERVWFV